MIESLKEKIRNRILYFLPFCTERLTLLLLNCNDDAPLFTSFSLLSLF